MVVVVALTVNPSVLATGASLTGATVIETVAVAEFSRPSLTRKVNESAPK